jgi:hypothetical protein
MEDTLAYSPRSDIVFSPEQFCIALISCGSKTVIADFTYQAFDHEARVCLSSIRHPIAPTCSGCSPFYDAVNLVWLPARFSGT